MIDQLLQYDTEVFLYLNQLGNTHWDGFWRIVTLKWSSIPLYAFLLFLVYKRFGPKGTLIIMVCAALLVTATDQLANLFKYGVARPRPCQVESLKDTMRFVAERCGRYGYFSAHAASSMGVAVFLGLSLQKWYRYLPFLLLFWAAVVAYSRIYLGVHYPLDILTGMVIGGGIGWLVYRLQNYLRFRFRVS
ncbi:MAG: phosphatase PAP2 family protein [Flavobacteriales bacterium]|jgi:undecaprenyl-diphosphatase|uniref:phosphatase PAP2 family protein n=1 Tax=Candidatus Ulvibacter alkanivorans TaxID=2267620 RepID=UPI000DF22C1C|nr:phosphatase PAP2 family protein [Candidatus Ulvibacter alkanivorans]MCH2489645.1 phosphatase PAP2 family protein [Flavobacteriales bacterium]